MSSTRSDQPPAMFVEWFDQSVILESASAPDDFSEAVQQRRDLASTRLGALGATLLMGHPEHPEALPAAQNADCAALRPPDGQRASALASAVHQTFASAVALISPDVVLCQRLEAGPLSCEPLPVRAAADTAPGPLPTSIPPDWSDQTRSGAFLRSIESYSYRVTELCIEISALLGWPVTMTGLLGTTTDLHPSDDVKDRLIVALDGRTSIGHETDRSESQPLAHGQAVWVNHRAQCTDSVGFTALAITPHPATDEVVKRYATRKAAHWPLLRSDVPIDVARPVLHYGQDHPTNTVDFLKEELRKLDPGAIIDESLLGYQLSCSVGAARRWVSEVPLMSSERFDAAEFVGVLPLGAAVLGRGDHRAHVAADGKVMSLDSDMLELMPLVLSGRRFTVGDMGELASSRAREAVTALLSAGWVDLAHDQPLFTSEPAEDQ